MKIIRKNELNIDKINNKENIENNIILINDNKIIVNEFNENIEIENEDILLNEDIIYFTEEEAIEVLLKTTKNNDKQYYVKCFKKDDIEPLILKKEIETKERFDKIANEIGVKTNLKYDIDEEVGYFTQESPFMKNILLRFKEQSSKTKTCDNCKSVINRDYINTTFCPLCKNKTFLTTNTDIERAKKIKKKLLLIQKEIKEIINKRENKIKKMINELEYDYLTIEYQENEK